MVRVDKKVYGEEREHAVEPITQSGRMKMEYSDTTIRLKRVQKGKVWKLLALCLD